MSDGSAPVELDMGHEARIHAYADWVRSLIEGDPKGALNFAANDPLNELGTELERLARTISDREEQLRRLLELVQTVESGIFLNEVLDKIFEGFRNSIPYDRIGCAFVSEDNQRAVAYWGRSTLGEMKIRKGFSQKLENSSLKKVLETRKPRILNDLGAYLAQHPTSASTRLILAEGGNSSLTCPLLHGGQPIGFLFFTSKERNSYNESHQTMYEQIARQVSIVIAKSRIYEKAIKQNELLKARSEELLNIANTDALTGVLSRRAIESALHDRHKEALNGGKGYGVIIADIDHFKKINDKFGHGVGDLALKEFTKRLTAAIRKSDCLGRFGGEEFLILVHCNDHRELHDAADRLRRAVAESPFPIVDDGHVVTASFGAAHVGEDPIAPPDLLRSADEALYKAKADGRNCTRIAEPGIAG